MLKQLEKRRLVKASEDVRVLIQYRKDLVNGEEGFHKILALLVPGVRDVR